MTAGSECAQAGRYVGRQVARPIIPFDPDEMIGQAYYSPVQPQTPDFFLFFVKRISMNITKSASKVHCLPKL